MSENELWTSCSNKLYLFCWKNKMEALRKTEKLSGNEWWLLQDFWTGSNGILDTYYEAKLTAADVDSIRVMNAPVLLTVAEPGDNLPIADDAARFHRAYVSKQTLKTSIHVSNYGPAIKAGATLSWSVTGITKAGSTAQVCSANTLTLGSIASSPNSTTLAPAVSCVLPDLGGFQHSPKLPVTLQLQASLHSSGGQLIASNSWRSRVYPFAEDGPGTVPIYTTKALCGLLPFGDMICEASFPDVDDPTVPPTAIFVSTFLDAALMELAANGHGVLLLDNGKIGDEASLIPFKTEPANVSLKVQFPSKSAASVILACWPK